MAELLLEFVFTFLFEIIAELLGYAVRARRKEPVPAFTAAFAFCVFGGLCGVLSLGIVRHQIIGDPWLGLANLAVTPVLIALLMDLLGRYKKSGGRQPLRIETFPYAWCFAFSFVLARFMLA